MLRDWLIGAAVAGLLTGPVAALDLILPNNAVQTHESTRNPDSYMLPVAPFSNGTLPVVKLEGQVARQAWRIEQPGATTLQMMAAIREQLSAAGYTILLDCGAQECGRFDFRFNTEVLAAPDMYVNLFDFRFLAARRTDPADDSAEHSVSLLVSQSSSAGHVQMIQVSTGGDVIEPKVVVEPDAPAAPSVVDVPTIETLREQGHVTLTDLDFGTGSAELGAGPHGSLEVLAAFLLEDESRRIALVGHTDRVGSLENNVALSRERATAVLERLVGEYGIPRDRLEAEGVGYLAPIASNEIAEGRNANRRVEAVLLGTQ